MLRKINNLGHNPYISQGQRKESQSACQTNSASYWTGTVQLMVQSLENKGLAIILTAGTQSIAAGHLAESLQRGKILTTIR